jgi:hypothetical protein
MRTLSWTISHSTPLNANKYEDIHGDVQGTSPSTFDPGGHLASLDVASLLPLHLPRVTSDAASYVSVSDCIPAMPRIRGLEFCMTVHVGSRHVPETLTCTRRQSRQTCRCEQDQG